MSIPSRVPPERITALNDGAIRSDAEFVLYWMVSARRLRRNFALDRAVEYARALRLPLVILEALRVDYPWASQRHHAFALDGMREHAAQLSGSPVEYYPYVELTQGSGSGLLASLASHAAVVVTDRFPAFFLPRMVESAARRLSVRLEAVDGNGLLPLTEAPKAFTTAYAFRRFLHKNLIEHLLQTPSEDPLGDADLPRASAVPEEISTAWPPASAALLERSGRVLEGLPIDQTVRASELVGGSAAAAHRLDRFLDVGLAGYLDRRNHPDEDGCSGLSPYLHWGHISAHDIFSRVAAHEGWTPARLSDVADGRREGWWGMRPAAEAFLDQLVTWRELGFVFCHHRLDYAQYESLPEWARDTLEAHAGDPRPHLYSLEALEGAQTEDEVWNAAQTQLTEQGVMHNYLRMLWGKKILEWTPHPRDALRTMIELNDRYALDGRDPNSYSGIFWVMGRFDRGWPERSVFGKVRCMTSASTRRKLRLKGYLERWGPSRE
jgi:deoxyribodipyrimidine photo-lyase